jgi:recombination protein RecA
MASKKLTEEIARLDKEYGHNTAALASDPVKLNVFPSGILALDYALGVGGLPRGQLIEVFGPEDIGKSSAVGLSAIRGAQSEGALCGIIAVEPNFDLGWAKKNGVDTDKVILVRPDDGETAFNILYDWVTGSVLDLILFDSIGALLKSTEIEVETAGRQAKPSAAGQSPLITWGIKRIVVPTWKKNKTVIFLNQIRDVMGTSYTMYSSPGGHALRHLSAARIQLKPGSGKDYEKIDGDSVLVGREIIAEVVRNKLHEGTRQRAIFQYWQKDNENGKVGVDLAEDVIRTGKKTGVITGTGWYHCDLFPDGGKLQGKPAVKRFLDENPEAYRELRKRVLASMNGTS